MARPEQMIPQTLPLFKATLELIGVNRRHDFTVLVDTGGGEVSQSVRSLQTLQNATFTKENNGTKVFC